MSRVFKPTRKLGGGQKMYRKWEEYEVGDVLIGRYVDTHTDQYKKVCPVIEVIDAQFKDKSGTKYIGKNLVLNAAGMLNKAIEKAEKGQLLQFTYNGQSTIEKGPYAGKESHLIQTDIVEEDVEL
jgi:hypothetical protein